MANYKLINNDATLAMKQLIEEGVKVDLIVTDPPYGVEFKSHYDDSKEYVFSNIKDWYNAFYQLLNDNCHMFIYVPVLEIHKWIQAGIDSGFKFKNIISTKAHFIGGSFKPKNGFSYEFQPILHFTKGTGRKFNKVDFFKTSDSWLNDKRNTNPNPFTYLYSNYVDKELSFANTKSVANNNKNTNKHPNEKEIKLIEFLIQISTEENQVVLDSFMGSGVVGKASFKHNREFIGIEQNEFWFNEVKKELQNDKTNQ